MSDRELYEQRAREVKVAKLLPPARALLQSPGVTIGSFVGADSEIRERLAKVAKCNVPSEATWRLLVERLRAEEAARAAQPDDPFEGLS